MTILRIGDVSRETSERLEIYVDLVRKWTRKINLISPSSVADIWTRHVMDSAQLVDISPSQPDRWLDVGSGGGFPGVVAAILYAERVPKTRFTMIESDRRKCEFLRTVSRETGVSFDVIPERIEQVERIAADVVSARALAPLVKLLEYVQRHRAPDGCALFLKGRSAADEIEQALDHWRFDCETVGSKTDPESVILKIGAIERV